MKLKIWDPFWCNGSVVATYAEVFPRFRHRCENFYEVYPRVLSPDIGFFFNPPFSQIHLVPILRMLNVIEQPFVAIMPRDLSCRQYFAVEYQSLVSNKKFELSIRTLGKGFPMKKLDREKMSSFTALEIMTYYPRAWNYTPPDDKFCVSIPKKSLLDPAQLM